MTAGARSWRPPGARAINLAPFGRYSRYMLGAYLRHALLVIVALMTVALTIDLWPQIPLLMADPAQPGWLTAWTVIRLCALRIPDLLPPFVPFATFLAVVWSETAFTESRERILVWNSGRSPLLCLAPAVMIGVLMGAGLFILDGYLRPAAIAVQISERLGREGRRLDRTEMGDAQWLALPAGLLRAQIEYGPPVRLHDTTIYKLDTDGHLSEVDTAVLAKPLPGDRWLLEDGHYWRADIAEAGAGNLVNSGEEIQIPFRERIISLKLNTLWLGNFGLSPQYLPMPVLASLTHFHISLRDDASFRTRLQTLRGEAFLPCAMALLAASLAMLFFAYRTPPAALIAVLLAGYLAHFAARSLDLMGEFGYVPPLLAGWLAPVMIYAASGAVLAAIQRRRGLNASLGDTPPFGPQTDVPQADEAPAT